MASRINLNIGGNVVGVTEEEPKTFCEKIEREI